MTVTRRTRGWRGGIAACRATPAGRAGEAARSAGAALAALVAGCDATLVGNAPGHPAAVVSAAVTAEPGAVFRTLSVTLDRESRVVVDYGDGDTALRVESAGAAAAHELLLPRLRPQREYHYEVRAVSAAGDTGIARAGSFATGALPPELAALRFEVTGEATFDLLMLEVGRPSHRYLPVIVDAEGHVVWYSLHEGRGSSGFTVFEDSLFVFNTAAGLEVLSPRSQEPLASLSRERGAQRTGVDPFFIHHDVIASPSGTLLFLVQDTTLARDTVWVGEAVWEWDPRTDALERRWRSGDFLDPATDRGPLTRPDDWLHANSLSLGPRGNVLVSFFWLHEVLSIAPGWGSVEWRLGGPASTFGGVELAMEAGQHTAAEVAPDRVLLFDNGRGRAQGLFSRALELELDRGAGEARVVWQFRPTPDIHAPIVSSAFRLANGNTVVGFGLGRHFPGFGDTGPLAIFEVTPAETVRWRMEVAEGADLVYRATPMATVAGERRLLSP